MAEDVEVRPARAEDADAIVGLWKDFVAFLSPRDPRYEARPGAYEKWRDYFLNRMLEAEHAALFVAEADGGELVGVVEARITGGHPVFKVGKHGQVFGHFVRASHRDQGVGAQLMDAAERWFRDKELPYYRTNVLAWLPSVKDRYQGLGMEHAEWVMEKQL